MPHINKIKVGDTVLLSVAESMAKMHSAVVRPAFVIEASPSSLQSFYWKKNKWQLAQSFVSGNENIPNPRLVLTEKTNKIFKRQPKQLVF